MDIAEETLFKGHSHKGIRYVIFKCSFTQTEIVLECKIFVEHFNLFISRSLLAIEL